MKKLFSIIVLLVILSFNVKAQNIRTLSVNLSTNQIDMSFQHNIIIERLWMEIYAGVGNQDINNYFDDFISGLGVGFNAFSKNKNQVAVETGIGLYIPDNNYYSGTIPLLNAGVRYLRFLGKSGKNCLLIKAGYRYGKRDFKQEYSSEIVNVSTIETFTISPLYFSIGYGFIF
jgi:hypothetical protein